MALADKLEQLPARPGVYLFKDAKGAIVYVGKARVLRDRVRSYFQASRPPSCTRRGWRRRSRDLELVVTDSEMEALALENNLIKRHQPFYNVRLRDDKNHPYLKLTLKEEYPRLYVVRRPGEDGNAYGGPYIPASLGRRTAALVRRLFGIRSCKETLNGRRPRPCLQYQIKRCIAPCVAEICSLERYRRACEDARLFLEGRTEEVTRAPARADGQRRGRGALRAGGVAARPGAGAGAARGAAEDHHHRHRGARRVRGARRGRAGGGAGVLRARRQGGRARGLPARPPDRARARAVGDAAAVLRGRPLRAARDRGAGRDPGPRAARGLARRAPRRRRAHPRAAARREAAARRARGYATRGSRSSSSGSTRASSRRRSCARCATCSTSSSSRSASSASTSRTSRARTWSPRWSCSRRGSPKKSDYRKFRIRSVSGAPDDFASMREVVGRRYKRLLEEGKELPDLVLIDGGKGQLGAAVDALEELGLGEQPVASLAKREELIFVRGRELPIALPHTSPVLQLVQRVRDEAHRFAIGFHRQVRSRRTIASELDDVPGIGPAKRPQAALGLRLGPRRPRRERGRARRRRRQGQRRAPARALRRSRAELADPLVQPDEPGEPTRSTRLSDQYRAWLHREVPSTVPRRCGLLMSDPSSPAAR